MKRVMMHNLGLRDINPLTCGIQNCPSGHQWGPAVREFLLLHYVHAGTGVFHNSRGRHSLQPGQIFIIRPQETVSYQADLHTPWTYSWIGFTCGFSLDEVLCGDILTAPESAHIFHAMGDAGHIQAGREWYICGKIYELLTLLRATAAPKRDDASQYVRMAQNYIESQYVEPVKIAGVARSLNLNRSYFSKIFREHTGKSPQQYLVDFRLQKAAELLTTRMLPTGEVARRVGYTDVFNFSRMFRRRYGVSPSHYHEQKPLSAREPGD